MKNLNYIISGVLGAAVIVLFVLQFSGNPSTEGNSGDSAAGTAISTATGEGDKIAFIRIDSVLANWELYFDVQEELSNKQQQLETDFDKKSQDFMKRVEDAQYKIQRGLVTRAEAEQLQQQLASEEQNLMGLQNDYAAQIQEQGVVRNRQMIDKIEQYLKKYNQTAGYDFIFSYSFGGNLLYANKSRDITAEVIEGINKEFPAEDK